MDLSRNVVLPKTTPSMQPQHRMLSSFGQPPRKINNYSCKVIPKRIHWLQKLRAKLWIRPLHLRPRSIICLPPMPLWLMSLPSAISKRCFHRCTRILSPLGQSYCVIIRVKWALPWYHPIPLNRPSSLFNPRIPNRYVLRQRMARHCIPVVMMENWFAGSRHHRTEATRTKRIHDRTTNGIIGDRTRLASTCFVFCYSQYE